MSSPSSNQRGGIVRPPLSTAPVEAESQKRLHCLNMSCWSCNDASDALRKPSTTCSNITSPFLAARRLCVGGYMGLVRRGGKQRSTKIYPRRGRYLRGEIQSCRYVTALQGMDTVISVACPARAGRFGTEISVASREDESWTTGTKRTSGAARLARRRRSRICR